MQHFEERADNAVRHVYGIIGTFLTAGADFPDSPAWRKQAKLNSCEIF